MTNYFKEVIQFAWELISSERTENFDHTPDMCYLFGYLDAFTLIGPAPESVESEYRVIYMNGWEDGKADRDLLDNERFV